MALEEYYERLQAIKELKDNYFKTLDKIRDYKEGTQPNLNLLNAYLKYLDQRSIELLGKKINTLPWYRKNKIRKLLNGTEQDI